MVNNITTIFKENYHYSFNVPLNRFWTSVCYYFIFLAFLMTAILTQVGIHNRLDLPRNGILFPKLLTYCEKKYSSVPNLLNKTQFSNLTQSVNLNALQITDNHQRLSQDISVLINSTMDNSTKNTQNQNKDEFSSYYIILSVFAVSMLWENFLQFIAVKSWNRNYLNFWRSYDLIMKIGLSLALIFRKIRVQENVDENFARELDRGEVVLFANITTMALIR